MVVTRSYLKNTHISLKIPLIVFYLILLLASPLLAEQKSWLQSFPDIRYDEKLAYFSNVKWTAVYNAKTGAMYTVPRDSIELPEPGQRNVALSGIDVFVCGGPGLIYSPGIGGDQEFSLPELSGNPLSEIAGTWRLPPDVVKTATEITGPCIWHRDKIWFGLRAELSSEKKLIGGIGWFDPKTEQIGRIYSSGMNGLYPNSLCARADTVYACFDNHSKEKRVGRLFSYSLTNSQLAQVDPRGVQIPGESVFAVAAWYNVLLISTDQAVAVWDLSPKPRSWITRAVSARKEVWTKAILFDKETGKPTAPPVKFFPLAVNTVTEVMARIDDWIEVVTPVGIEGYCYFDQWPKMSKVWAEKKWDCPGLCFCRIRVPTKDGDILGDYLDTPVTAIEMQKTGVKVGFAAGWVDINEVTPVLVPATR